MNNRDNVFNELQREQPEQPVPPVNPQTPAPPPANNGMYGYPHQYNPNQQQNNMYGYPPYGTPVPMYNIPAPEQRAALEEKESKQRIKNEKAIVVLFVILVVIAAALGISGIVYDIATSRSRIESMDKATKVVIYQNSKPENSAELTEKMDEYGRYTTEGVAAAVRDSIVEIYTYSDAFQNKLKGTGSGVVLNDDGYIVTNAHVLDAEGYHDVHTADGKIYSATIVGRDAKTDIAVLKVNSSTLVPAVLGDSDEVVVGEEVVAIGNPAGLTGTVTNGIVSAVNREIRSDTTGFEMNCIQTNAAISPGNSGGALVNIKGQLVGVNSSKIVSESYEGMGFSIPTNTTKDICDKIIAKEYDPDPYIGVTISERYDAETLKKYGFPVGAVVYSVASGSPAEKAGIKSGDIITEFNGVAITDYTVLDQALSSCKPKDTVTIKIYRSRKYYSANITVGSNNSQ